MQYLLRYSLWQVQNRHFHLPDKNGFKCFCLHIHSNLHERMNLILYCYLLWVKPSGKTTVLPCEGTARYIDKKEKYRVPGLPMFPTYFLFTEPTSNIFFSSYKNWKCGIFCGITTLYDLLQINLQ